MRKPSQKTLREAKELLAYVYREAQRLADVLDPDRKGPDQPGEAEGPILLAVLQVLYTNAGGGLNTLAAMKDPTYLTATEPDRRRQCK